MTAHGEYRATIADNYGHADVMRGCIDGDRLTFETIGDPPVRLRLTGGGRDLAAAVPFLARQPGIGVGKIAVLGESMGGEQALAAAGANPRIRAVVAEGAEGQQYADHGWRPHDIIGIIDRGTEWVQYTA